MSETIIEILIDHSGSMGFMKGAGVEHEDKYLIDGQTRMSLVKKILNEQIIPTIDYANKIFIRTFRFNTTTASDDTLFVPLIYEGIFDKAKIQSIISSIQDPPPGGTPITGAINIAVANLEKYENCDRKIILLTDGEENGGGNYIEASKKAMEMKGIPCKTFIIGIAQDEQSEKKAIAIATGGYYNIKTNATSTSDLQKVLIPLKKAVLQNTIQNIQKATNIVNPQPSIQQNKTTEIVKEKIEILKSEKAKETTNQLTDFENKLKQQIQNSEKLLIELASIKESIRLSALLDTGIDATTLTIDSDYSESIRKASETFLYKFLCEKFGSEKVKWLNQTEESFLHHDFEILDEKGNTINFVECKGTVKEKPTFYLTSSEWTFFTENKDTYQICRVFNVQGEMYVVCIDNLLTALLSRQVVPYLLRPEILKEERVFLTLLTT
jgi:Domain of unknown function (DUF3883)/von Willebrand factor type A domain